MSPQATHFVFSGAAAIHPKAASRLIQTAEDHSAVLSSLTAVRDNLKGKDHPQLGALQTALDSYSEAFGAQNPGLLATAQSCTANAVGALSDNLWWQATYTLLEPRDQKISWLNQIRWELSKIAGSHHYTMKATEDEKGFVRAVLGGLCTFLENPEKADDRTLAGMVGEVASQIRDSAVQVFAEKAGVIFPNLPFPETPMLPPVVQPVQEPQTSPPVEGSPKTVDEPLFRDIDPDKLTDYGKVFFRVVWNHRPVVHTNPQIFMIYVATLAKIYRLHRTRMLEEGSADFLSIYRAVFRNPKYADSQKYQQQYQNLLNELIRFLSQSPDAEILVQTALLSGKTAIRPRLSHKGIPIAGGPSGEEVADGEDRSVPGDGRERRPVAKKPREKEPLPTDEGDFMEPEVIEPEGPDGSDTQPHPVVQSVSSAIRRLNELGASEAIADLETYRDLAILYVRFLNPNHPDAAGIIEICRRFAAPGLTVDQISEIQKDLIRALEEMDRRFGLPSRTIPPPPKPVVPWNLKVANWREILEAGGADLTKLLKTIGKIFPGSLGLGDEIVGYEGLELLVGQLSPAMEERLGRIETAQTLLPSLAHLFPTEQVGEWRERLGRIELQMMEALEEGLNREEGEKKILGLPALFGEVREIFQEVDEIEVGGYRSLWDLLQKKVNWPAMPHQLREAFEQEPWDPVVIEGTIAAFSHWIEEVLKVDKPEVWQYRSREDLKLPPRKPSARDLMDFLERYGFEKDREKAGMECFYRHPVSGIVQRVPTDLPQAGKMQQDYYWYCIRAVEASLRKLGLMAPAQQLPSEVSSPTSGAGPSPLPPLSGREPVKTNGEPDMAGIVQRAVSNDAEALRELQRIGTRLIHHVRDPAILKGLITLASGGHEFAKRVLRAIREINLQPYIKEVKNDPEAFDTCRLLQDLVPYNKTVKILPRYAEEIFQNPTPAGLIALCRVALGPSSALQERARSRLDEILKKRGQGVMILAEKIDELREEEGLQIKQLLQAIDVLKTSYDRDVRVLEALAAEGIENPSAVGAVKGLRWAEAEGQLDADQREELRKEGEARKAAVRIEIGTIDRESLAKLLALLGKWFVETNPVLLSIYPESFAEMLQELSLSSEARLRLAVWVAEELASPKLDQEIDQNNDRAEPHVRCLALLWRGMGREEREKLRSYITATIHDALVRRYTRISKTSVLIAENSDLRRLSKQVFASRLPIQTFFAALDRYPKVEMVLGTKRDCNNVIAGLTIMGIGIKRFRTLLDQYDYVRAAEEIMNSLLQTTLRDDQNDRELAEFYSPLGAALDKIDPENLHPLADLFLPRFKEAVMRWYKKAKSQGEIGMSSKAPRLSVMLYRIFCMMVPKDRLRYKADVTEWMKTLPDDMKLMDGCTIFYLLFGEPV